MKSAMALIDQELGPDDDTDGDSMNDMVEKTATTAPDNSTAVKPKPEEQEARASKKCDADAKESCFMISIAAFPGYDLQVTIGGGSGLCL